MEGKAPPPSSPSVSPQLLPFPSSPRALAFLQSLLQLLVRMVSLLVLLALGFLAFTCQNMCWNPHAGRLSPLCPNTSTYAPETSGNHLVPVLQVFSPFLNTQASNNIFKIILGCTQKEHTQKAGWLALIDSLIKHPESPSFGPSLVLGQGFPGIPRWHDGKESACQCRTCKRLGLDPWVRKSPWRRK